jgi:hypothetical protein
MVTVSKNFLEIHLFWAGKGTVDIPTKDNYYGPMISALSVTPSKHHTKTTAGSVIFAADK